MRLLLDSIRSLPTMEVKFYGVRGSVAAGGSATARYGGNTSCVSVRAGGHQLIFDSGTGIRQLGAELAPPVEAHLFFSHLHWDHIQGFPFFGPAFVPGNRIHIRAIKHPGEHFQPVEQVLSEQMLPPTFPIGIEVMGAELIFEDLPLGQSVELSNDVVVSHTAVDHPNGCFAYRVDHAGSSVVYATDLEHDESGEVGDELVELARGVDLLIFDAMYTPEEYRGEVGPSRKGWGHSTFEAGAALAERAGAKSLCLFHHDPSHDDEFMDQLIARARAHYPGTEVAREGLAFTL